MSALRVSLALLSLLALLRSPGGAARAHCTPAADYQTREEYQPIIVASTTSEESYRFGIYLGRQLESAQSVLNTVYGKQITLICSSNNASNIIIQDGAHQLLQAISLNSTAIQVIIEKLDIGEYTYSCTHNYSGCNDSLTVLVDPAISVMAPRVHYTNKHITEVYFVPCGEDFYVFCSANQAASLTMDVYPSTTNEPLLVQTINETTIALNGTVAEVKKEHYTCSMDSVAKRTVRVIMDYYPEAGMFRCILYASASGMTLECTWISSSKENTFRLYVLNEDESLLICRDKSDSLSRGCASALDEELAFIAYNDFILQLRACNEVFCSNQSFSINSVSVTKVAVINLKIRNTTSQGVVLEWRREDWSSMKYIHRIEYRLLGTEWRQVNASSVEYWDYDACFVFHLKLPCPDAHYEVRVYSKYEAATEDVYWSDPVSIFFFTSSSDGEVDPSCNENLREVTEKTPTSATLMLHEVRELISDEREAKLSLNKLKSVINQKLAKIRPLLKSEK